MRATVIKYPAPRTMVSLMFDGTYCMLTADTLMHITFGEVKTAYWPHSNDNEARA